MPPVNDSNLMDFLSGNVAETTGYVPTISNLSFYLKLVKTIAVKQKLPGVVIYTIRPSQAFYSVNHSLQYSMMNTQATNPRLSQHLQTLFQAEIMSSFRIWIADFIPSKQIESATVFQLEGTTLKPILTVSNKNYVLGEPTMNSAPICMTNGPDYFIQYGDLSHMRTLPGESCGAFSSLIIEKDLIENKTTHQVCSWHHYPNLKSRIMNY